MGKLLRVLTVVFLLLAAGALALGIMLFNRRELLKGRTQKLEKAVVQLGSLIEAEPPKAEEPTDFAAKDVSPLSVDFLENPELSTFWDNYSKDLEVTDAQTMNLAQRTYDLMRYYKRDPATGKIMKDPMGLPITTGEGTMQTVLDDLLAKAESQYNRLNETRQQLVTTRKELVATIEELNETKHGYRGQLQKIAELEAQIDRLQAQVRDLTARNEALQEEKQALENQLAEERRQVQILQDQNTEMEQKIAQLTKELQQQREVTDTQTRPPMGPEEGPPIALSPGVKGTVVAVDPLWNFAVIALTDPFLKELLGEDLSGKPPAVELMVKRPGGEEIFVTKVLLRQVRRDKKLAVADILPKWQQHPVQEGDVVFF